MEVIQQQDIGDFFEYVRNVRKDIEDWKIIEIRLTEAGVGLYTIDDITQKMQGIYGKKPGKILICNDREILAIINLGRKIPTTAVTKRITNTLPEHSCYIDVDTFTEGITKIQLNLDKDQAPPKRKKAKKVEGCTLIIDKDSTDRRLLKKTAKRYGKVYVSNNATAALKTFVKKTPNIVFINEELDSDDKTEFMKLALRHEPAAHIVLIGTDNTTNAITMAYQKGAKNYLLKPFSEKTSVKAIEDCPFFEQVIPKKQKKITRI